MENMKLKFMTCAMVLFIGTLSILMVVGSNAAGVGVNDPHYWYTEPEEYENLGLTFAYAEVGNTTGTLEGLNFTYNNATLTYTSDAAIRVRNPSGNIHNILDVTMYLSPIIGTLEAAYYPLCYRSNVTIYNQTGVQTQNGTVGTAGLHFVLNENDTGAAGEYMFLVIEIWPDVTEDHMANASLRGSWVMELLANPVGELGGTGGGLGLGGLPGPILPPFPPLPPAPMTVSPGFLPMENYGPYTSELVDYSANILGTPTKYTWGDDWNTSQLLPWSWVHQNNSATPGTPDYFRYVLADNMTYATTISGRGISGVALPNHYTVRIRDKTGASVYLREMITDGTEGFAPMRTVNTPGTGSNFGFIAVPTSINKYMLWLSSNETGVYNFTLADELTDELDEALGQFSRGEYGEWLPAPGMMNLIDDTNPSVLDVSGLSVGNYTVQVTGSYWDPVTDTFLAQPDHEVKTTFLEIVEAGPRYPNGTLIPIPEEPEEPAPHTDATNFTDSWTSRAFDDLNIWADDNGAGIILLSSVAGGGTAIGIILTRPKKPATRRKKKGGVF